MHYFSSSIRESQRHGKCFYSFYKKNKVDANSCRCSFSTKDLFYEVDGPKHPQKWFSADFARGIGCNRALSHVAEIEFQPPSVSRKKREGNVKYCQYFIFAQREKRRDQQVFRFKRREKPIRSFCRWCSFTAWGWMKISETEKHSFSLLHGGECRANVERAWVTWK